MRRNACTAPIAIVALLAVVALTAGWAIGRPTPAASQDGVEVFFSPKGGCTEVIINMIEGARETVRVQAYSFTSAPIAKAILNAHKSGVEVTVVLDSSQRTAQYSSATFFRNQGVPVYIDGDHAIAHNKVIQLHQRRRAAQRREPPGDREQGCVDEGVPSQLRSAPQALRGLRRTGTG